MAEMTQDSLTGGYLTGQLLVAMPNMEDDRFTKSVIYLCAHNPQGAMGLIVNRRFGVVTMRELLRQLEVEGAQTVESEDIIRYGGPVEHNRGFVLHSVDYLQDASMQVDDYVAMTATLDILRAIADGRGPKQAFLALGYAGWGPGQLDLEIQNNGWLNVSPDPQILFDNDIDTKWERAMSKIGVDPHMLLLQAGHA
jgi:putative transcriptional regulator